MSRWSRAGASVLLIGAFASTVAAAPKQGQARGTRPGKPPRATSAPRDRFPAVSLFGAHVGEALAYRPFDGKGRARKDAPRALERLLRCRQTGAKHRLNPRLGEALYQIGRHFAGHRMEIFSGYRPRAFCTRAHSRHMTGSAIDFHVEGIDNTTLIAYLKKAFHPAGVGFYPHGVHVHLDVERSVDTYWVDAGPPPASPEPALDPQIAASPETSPPVELPGVRDSAPLPEVEAEPAEPEGLPRPPEAPLGDPPAVDPQIPEAPRSLALEPADSQEQGPSQVDQ